MLDRQKTHAEKVAITYAVTSYCKHFDIPYLGN